MIKIEKTEVVGWEAAIRGMRNPMNSWEKSDSDWFDLREEAPTGDGDGYSYVSDEIQHINANFPYFDFAYAVGPNDKDLMLRLNKGGPVEAKYRRMIVVYVDITAPLYWWKEFDTYKVGTVANSCSTMHKIHSKEFTIDDFSTEHLINQKDIIADDGYVYYSNPNLFIYDLDKDYGINDEEVENEDEIEAHTDVFWASKILNVTIEGLNYYRNRFLETNDKRYWWQMIQLLPTSYNQKRTVMLNYEVLANIYPKRKNHKLDEWHDFCHWIEELPLSELITGGENNDNT